MSEKEIFMCCDGQPWEPKGNYKFVPLSEEELSKFLWESTNDGKEIFCVNISRPSRKRPSKAREIRPEPPPPCRC